MSVLTASEFSPEQLKEIGLSPETKIHYQLDPETLTRQSIERGEGTLNDTGALVIKTGKFTGRSPKDKYTVRDSVSEDAVNWNNFNIPIEEKYFFQLKEKMLNYLSGKEVWIRDCFACADTNYRLHLRVINEQPAHNMFCYNMFIRPEQADLQNFKPHWNIIQAPGFLADPATDGVKNQNFAILSFAHKIILIGGTAYTGEMKKGIFTMLNFVLPHRANVLSMHCSANMGKEGDTAIFFGLSGTGKTTLSADPNRKLIGDDEHGWTGDSVFNFEGGCYAKCIDLSAEKEPEIYNAIRPGAILENIVFHEGTNRVDFASKEITENTRVSYPLSFISNALVPSIGKTPKNIFFLTADAYGILPPISRLNPGQAMYQFISGYTAKVAGTEAGVTEPKSTFSTCFGAPFLPLHPGKYAEMLGEKIRESNAKVWLINTGWTGGPYGVGSRMKLPYTRAMITAALEGKLNNVEYIAHPVFGFEMPVDVPGVPSEVLNPAKTWDDENEYYEKAKSLAKEFTDNFKQYESGVNEEIRAAAPKSV